MVLGGCGRDAYRHGLQALARAEGLADKVLFVDATPHAELPYYYAAADLFVTASWREGFPRSAMEAAAMGLPTVATDIRGNRQVIADEETGLLVTVRDAESIASAVERLAGDCALRDAMGRNARARAAAEFDQARVIARTLDAYRLLPT